MPQPAAAPILSGADRLAAVYQLKIHLLGISPQICRRVLVRGDTTLAELHHVFQVVMGWDNWHLHSFKLWGKEYGMPYAGGSTPASGQCRRNPWQWLLNPIAPHFLMLSTWTSESLLFAGLFQGLQALHQGCGESPLLRKRGLGAGQALQGVVLRFGDALAQHHAHFPKRGKLLLLAIARFEQLGRHGRRQTDAYRGGIRSGRAFRGGGRRSQGVEGLLGMAGVG